MTDPSHAEHRLDQWLATGMAELDAALNDVLDIEAGVTDARLPEVQTTLTRALDDVLDLDTGLSRILPDPPSPIPKPPLRPPAPLADTSSLSAKLGRFADQLASLPIAERLAVRTWLPERKLSRVRVSAQFATRALDLAHALDRALDLDRDLAHILDLILRHVLDRALHLVGDLIRTRTHDLIRIRTHGLTRDITHTLASVRDLAHDRAHALDLTCDRTFDLNCDINHARALTQNLAHALTWDIARDFIHALGHDRTRDYGGTLTHDLGRALSHEVPYEVFDHDLVDVIDRLIGVVTNVMGADLSYVDLSGIPLEGLRWSTETRWPADWERYIRQNSIELEPGLYEIRNGGVHMDNTITTCT